MVKCTQCGAEYPDGQKFCGSCGTKLVNVAEEKCPACGATIAPESAFCGSCGAKVVREKYKVCPSCGAEYPLDSKFCVNDGADLRDVEPVTKLVAVPSDGATDQKPAKKSSKASESVKGFKNKAVAFENKHFVIRNGVIALLSLIFVFFALFMPINVMGYSDDELIYTDGFEDIVDVLEMDVDDGDELSVACHPVKVRQSIWKLFAAFKYKDLDREVKSDFELIEDITEDYEKAVQEARDEAFDEVAVKSSSTGQLTIPESKLPEYYEEFEDSLSKHLSKINYIAYLLARDVAVLEDGRDDDGEEYSEVLAGDPGMYAADVATLAFGTVVAVLSILFAASAVAALVLAIIGMVKKNQKLGLMRFLMIATVASAALCLLSAFAPLGKAGGAMLAIFLISAFVWLLSGVTQTVIIGDVKVSKLICRSAFALLLIVGMILLLCTNCICLRASSTITETTITETTSEVRSASILIKLYAPVGSLFSEALQDAVTVSEGVKLEPDIDLTGAIASGIISYIIAIIALAALTASVVLALKVLASTDQNKKLPLISPIVSTIFVFALIIATGAVSGILFNAFADPIEEGDVGIKVKTEILFMYFARAQVYFTLVFAAAAMAYSLVSKFKKKSPAVDAGATGGESTAENASATGEQSGDAQGEQTSVTVTTT